MRTTIGAAKRLLVRQRIVPQSLSCSRAGSAYLRNWISGTGISPASAMPTARPIMPSSDRTGVEHAGIAELSCKTERHRVHAALGPDILAEQQDPGIAELVVERAADGGDHVDALAFGAGVSVEAGRIALGQLAAFVLKYFAFEEHVTWVPEGSATGALFRSRARLLGGRSPHLPRSIPFALAQHVFNCVRSFGIGSRAHSASTNASGL